MSAGEPGVRGPPAFVVPLDFRFIAVGLFLTVIGGTALGAIHLAWVQGLMRPSPATHVQAHAHAQVFGFFGLFLAGFGYHLLPRFLRRPLPWPKLARGSFWLLAGGGVLHFLGQPATRWPVGFWLLGASGPLLAAGGIAFAVQVVALFRGFDSREGFHRWVTFGVVGFALGAALDGVLAVRAAVLGEALYPHAAAQALWLVALFGGVVPFTIGVAARAASPMTGAGMIRPLPLRIAHALWFAAVPVQVVAWALPWGNPLRTPLMVGSAGVLGLGVLVAALALLFPKSRHLPLSADPFFSACVIGAFAMLGFGGAVMVSVAVGETTGWVAPWVLHDVARHLVTIGLLIPLTVGMATRLVPALLGVPLRWPHLREWVLGLLALALILRTGGGLAAFGVTGALRASSVSGMMAWVALCLFALMLGGTFFESRRARRGGA